MKNNRNELSDKDKEIVKRAADVAWEKIKDIPEGRLLPVLITDLEKQGMREQAKELRALLRRSRLRRFSFGLLG